MSLYMSTGSTGPTQLMSKSDFFTLIEKGGSTMIMSTIFIVFLIAIIFAWRGKRRAAYLSFGISLILGVLVFIHHITSHLNLDL